MQGIGFIGVGNMGAAMAKSILAQEKEVAVYDLAQSVYTLFEERNVSKKETVHELVKSVKYVVLSIKPQYYESVCKEIKSYLQEEHIVVTVAPSYSISRMKELLGEEIRIIRTMPNTPALIGAGATAYTYEDKRISKDEIEMFLDYFNSFGKTFRVEEHLMPAVVAASGSSPAYGYIFIEAMADAAVSFGMPRAMAYEMSALAIKGACEMVLETKKHPGELKDAVTSPAGTTIEAVIALEESGFRNSVMKAMKACFDKTNNMSK